MVRKSTTAAAKDDFARELEEALELDDTEFALSDEGDLDIAASMEDLEAQISQAAEELARENGEPATQAAVGKAELKAPEKKAELSQSSMSDLDGDFESEDIAPRTSSDTVRPAGQPVTPAPAATFAAANDDLQRNSTSPYLTRPELKSSSSIYWLTALLSVVWLVGGVLLAHLLYAPEIWQIGSLEALVQAPYALGMAVGTVLPILLFWAFAIMMRRAQEMRLAANQMAEMAFRLAEPENLAQDRVMMVGQAVRREVQAMGEGIERTLARAVELETLVHTEVNELERAYSENESRIRLLVDSLGSEREGIVSHAERVRASITGAHEILKEELDSAGEQIRLSVDGASRRLTESLSDSGNSLVERLSVTGETIHKAVDERVSSLSEKISLSGDAIASLLDTRIASFSESGDALLARVTESTSALNQALEQRSEEISSKLDVSGETLSGLLDNRIATLSQKTDEATRTLGEMFDSRVSGLLSSVGDVSGRINEEFDNRLLQIENTLSERGQSLIAEFSTRRRGPRYGHGEAERRTGSTCTHDQRVPRRANPRDRRNTGQWPQRGRLGDRDGQEHHRYRACGSGRLDLPHAGRQGRRVLQASRRRP